MMPLCAAIDELDVIEGAGAGTLALLTTAAGAVTNSCCCYFNAVVVILNDAVVCSYR
jgi:hypothetical protein